MHQEITAVFVNVFFGTCVQSGYHKVINNILSDVDVDTRVAIYLGELSISLLLRCLVIFQLGELLLDAAWI